MTQWVKGHNPQFENNIVVLWYDSVMVKWAQTPIFFIEQNSGQGSPLRRHKDILNKLEALDGVYLKVLKPVVFYLTFSIALGKLRTGDWKLHMHLMSNRG